MTYENLKLLINAAYADFTFEDIKRRKLGADSDYTTRNLFFVAGVFKCLMRQEGDETKDLLTKEDIQNIIRMFNKYSDSIVQIEYE